MIRVLERVVYMPNVQLLITILSAHAMKDSLETHLLHVIKLLNHLGILFL